MNETIIHKISGITGKGNNITAILHSEVLDKKGKTLSTGNNTVKCSNGVLMMDMRLFIPQQQAEQFGKAEARANNVYLEYPAGIKTGDHLKDGKFDIEVDNNGLQQSLKMQIINRNVSGKERVTTIAGAWDCFVITYQVKLNIQTGPIAIPLNLEATEWFSPGFGIVKTSTKSGTTEVVSIR